MKSSSEIGVVLVFRFVSVDHYELSGAPAIYDGFVALVRHRWRHIAVALEQHGRLPSGVARGRCATSARATRSVSPPVTHDEFRRTRERSYFYLPRLCYPAVPFCLSEWGAPRPTPLGVGRERPRSLPSPHTHGISLRVCWFTSARTLRCRTPHARVTDGCPRLVKGGRQGTLA